VFAGVRKASDAEDLQRSAGPRLTPIFLDITDATQVASAVEKVSAEIGAEGLTGLVNNAGIAIAGPLEFIPLDRFRRQFEVNVLGTLAVTQAFLPLIRLGKGRIVNLSSVSGLIAYPFFGPYSASKFALEALTDSLRRELVAWGIKVISIEPGSIATPIWEKSLKAGNDLLSKLPETALGLYGRQIRRVQAYARRSAQTGLHPDVVAHIVATALTHPRPRTRYVIGRRAKLTALLVRLLPDRWLDWLYSLRWLPAPKENR
jgi:NAD(P)-dependent dehydrogenase (short-subunit alcohol dehydrogenase family)